MKQRKASSGVPFMVVSLEETRFEKSFLFILCGMKFCLEKTQLKGFVKKIREYVRKEMRHGTSKILLDCDSIIF